MTAPRTLGVFTAVLVLGVGCADRATDGVPRQTPAAGQTTVPDMPTIDWQNPLGTIATSFEEARSALAFDPTFPNIGTPAAISTDDPHGVLKQDRSIAFVYADPEIGEYYLVEGLPTMTQDHLEQLVDCLPGETGCSTEGWSLQPIRTGITALVIYAPESVSVATSVTWLEGGVQYTLMGHRATMTEERAIEIADRI